ncbi:MAG: hypothetical protein ACJA1R_000804, partial [Flavobacteriales bacterium]
VGWESLLAPLATAIDEAGDLAAAQDGVGMRRRVR